MQTILLLLNFKGSAFLFVCLFVWIHTWPPLPACGCLRLRVRDGSKVTDPMAQVNWLEPGYSAGSPTIHELNNPSPTDALHTASVRALSLSLWKHKRTRPWLP
jgi:hypothetical protein